MKSIRFKLLGINLIIVLLLSLLSIATYLLINNAEKNVNVILEEELPILIADEKLAFNLAQRIALARGYLLYPEDQSYKEAFMRYTEESKLLQEQIINSGASERGKELINKSIEWRKMIVEEIFTEIEKGNIEKAKTIMMEEATPLGREIMNGFEEVAINRENSIITNGDTAIVLLENLKKLLVIVSSVVIILAIGLSLWLSNTITTPIKLVVSRMQQIALGNLQFTNLVSKSKDETAQLMEATNTMGITLREIMKNLTQSSEIVTNQSKGLAESANEVRQTSFQITKTMEELASGAQDQAQDSAMLADSVSEFMKSMVVTNQAGAKVRTLTEEVKRSTESGNQLMIQSEQKMEDINTMVQESVNRVEGLNEKVHNITNLVNVITSIAEQTNLLALNAAIEAARAGEHGKGFAVVAEEVRKLAEEVKHSVTDITSIIDEVQQEALKVSTSLTTGYETVQSGTQQIKQTSDTFKTISTLIDSMTDGVSSISKDLEHLYDQSESMNVAITSIASVSEEAAAGIEETTASSEETSSLMEQILESAEKLANQSEQLNKITEQFKY
nr:HAMP domain-containing methyl-accepting chemotaxis protein [Bacillus pinisoli]